MPRSNRLEKTEEQDLETASVDTTDTQSVGKEEVVETPKRRGRPKSPTGTKSRNASTSKK